VNRELQDKLQELERIDSINTNDARLLKFVPYVAANGPSGYANSLTKVLLAAARRQGKSTNGSVRNSKGYPEFPISQLEARIQAN
jgi:hypothetical protein